MTQDTFHPIGFVAGTYRMVESITGQEIDITSLLARYNALRAERDAAYVRADTEYAARVRLTEKYDNLDAERDALEAELAECKAALVNERELNNYWQSHGGNDAALVTILERAAAETRVAALAAQVAVLREALEAALPILEHANWVDTGGLKAAIVTILAAAPEGVTK